MSLVLQRQQRELPVSRKFVFAPGFFLSTRCARCKNLCIEGSLERKEHRLSRPHRLDFPGAIHIVHVWGKAGFNIYFDPSVLNRAAERWSSVPHLLRFLKLLDGCCSEYGAQLFGYCMEPNTASLLMRTLGVPLEACMQRLGGKV